MTADVAHQLQKIQLWVFEEILQCNPSKRCENTVEIFPPGGQYARRLSLITGEFMSAALKVGPYLLLPHRLDGETKGHGGCPQHILNVRFDEGRKIILGFLERANLGIQGGERG